MTDLATKATERQRRYAEMLNAITELSGRLEINSIMLHSNAELDSNCHMKSWNTCTSAGCKNDRAALRRARGLEGE